MSTPVFELQNINYSYLGKFPALRDISIKVNQGERIAIIGANGSGKSTLLSLLDGLIFRDTGTMNFLGNELTEKKLSDDSFSSEFRKKVGLVFQNPDIQLFCPTVKEDILFGPLQLGINKQVMDNRFDEMVSLLNINDLLERSPHQLSIGEKRKVAIASTLIINPEVLLLDEPTAGLDPLTTRHIIDLLHQVHKSGTTIITSTHDLHIVEEISDTIHVFNKEKRIVKSGAPVDILSDIPFLQANNLVHIHGHIHQGKIHVHPHPPLEHHDEF